MPGDSLAKFLVIALDRTGLEDPALGTEIGRNLRSTAPPGGGMTQDLLERQILLAEWASQQ